VGEVGGDKNEREPLVPGTLEGEGKKARKMLGQLGGIGNSEWGVSATGWRSIYMGMIRAVVMWGSVGCWE